MLRWRKEKAEKIKSYLDEIRAVIDNIYIAFGSINKVLDVELDLFDQRMKVIEDMISCQQESMEELEDSNRIKFIFLVKNKLEVVRYCFLAASREDGININFRRSLAMDHLLDIFPLIRSYTGSNMVRQAELNPPMVREEKIKEIANNLVSGKTSSSPLLVFPIHGELGSGKTSLVYLVYNLDRVRNHFPRRVWIYWENISGVHDDQEILRIVEETGNVDSKYLIVLEDLLNENGESWFDLLKPLLSAFANCKPGSKIMVTSSNKPKKHLYRQLPMPEDAPYKMKVLHPDDSLDLFQCIAFDGIEEDRVPYMPIVLVILDKCENNPRVIRIIASFLSSQPPSKWQNFNEVVLDIQNPAKHILSIADLLMKQPEVLNYHTLFPLDYEFDKVEFSHLCDAHQQFTKPFDEIFECCKRDKCGVIVSYKVQALAHVVAKHLARDKYCLVEKRTPKVDPLRIQHLSFVVDSSWKAPPWLYQVKFLRSLLFIPIKPCETNASCHLDEILTHNCLLQALDVAGLTCRNYLESIGKLLKLRYLRLGVSSDTLPECITNLKLLETLDLRHSRVRELPVGFHKLCCLKHLYVGIRLIDLPPMFKELEKLQTLDVFIVGKQNGLDALAYFTLAGKLKIRYQIGRKELELRKDTTFFQYKNLHELSLEWPAAEDYQNEDALESELLQPPSNLKILTVKGWKGERFPNWAMDRFCSVLTNLVFIHITDCDRCKHLPSFSKIGCLKSLELWGLIALEWIENCGDNSMVSSETPYFPSLEHLSLVNLPQLKGWSKEEEHDADYKQEKHGNLSRLYDLKVSGCPELISMPRMPNLRSLEVSNIHGDLLQHFLGVQATPVSSSSASPVVPILQNLCSLKVSNMSIPEPLPRGFQYLTTIEELSLSWLYNLRILPESIGHLNQLHWLVIRYLPNLAEIPESLAVLSALRHVEIQYCPKLKQVPKYFSDLTSLRRLKIKECVNLERRCQQPDGERLESY